MDLRTRLRASGEISSRISGHVADGPTSDEPTLLTQGLAGTRKSAKAINGTLAVFHPDGTPPDVAVDTLSRSGFRPAGASVDELWARITGAAKARAEYWWTQGGRDDQAIRREGKQLNAFGKDVLAKGPRRMPVRVSEL